MYKEVVFEIDSYMSDARGVDFEEYEIALFEFVHIFDDFVAGVKLHPGGTKQWLVEYVLIKILDEGTTVNTRFGGASHAVACAIPFFNEFVEHYIGDLAGHHVEHSRVFVFDPVEHATEYRAFFFGCFSCISIGIFSTYEFAEDIVGYLIAWDGDTHGIIRKGGGKRRCR